jgi:hypothetical protein
LDGLDYFLQPELGWDHGQVGQSLRDWDFIGKLDKSEVDSFVAVKGTKLKNLGPVTSSA